MDVEKRDKFLKFRVTRVERYLTRAVAAADGKTMTSLFRDYVADRAAELFGSAFRQDASRQAEEQRAIGDRREPTL